MNFGFITYIIGWILKFQGAFLLVPCIVSMIYKEKSGFAFVISAIISFTIGMLCTRKKPQNRSFYAKEGFISVALGWIVLSISGSLPFIISGEITNIYNALFDSTIDQWNTHKSVFNNCIIGKSNLLFLIEDTKGNIFGQVVTSMQTAQCIDIKENQQIVYDDFQFPEQ